MNDPNLPDPSPSDPTPTESTSVAIVEDHPVFRQGLAGLVEDADGLQLACAVGSVPALDAELAVGDIAPTVVLLDLQLGKGGRQGTDAIGYLCARGLSVLVVSASASPATVVAAVAAGAAGYVHKEAEPEEIIRAIRTVADGASFISPTLAGYLLDTHQITLTKRESEILRLVAAGERDLDIAEQLFISVHTVHSHLDRIRAKTGRHRRVDLARFAIDRGLRSPQPPG
jgi:two-component system, NarL family, nitrate/nitrite response regulator NarL